ncbi:cyclodeaminase [Alkalihalobacillus hwajinpoensis]|uniref:cyclodeaminase n=1 Tax=Guptibacillus hwajinpoensis TaxID=208199 RepID=UPI001883F375|nr:cyclodeaminase [Pseudalkalibacillus hwajinpoensis]MBF0707523.1 cyclodeaminase [Pseudalkalibacillus hwajinpoensis]
MILLTEEEIRKHVVLNAETIQVVEDAFTSFATKRVEMPPIMRIDIPSYNGEVDVKSAYVEGLDYFAIKVSTGFFDNYKRGLPSGNGLMMLFHSQTGKPEALLLDNGYLTDIRTAAAGAVAAKHLSREDARTAGVIGSGSQARYQLEAISRVRQIERVLVYGRKEDNVARYMKDMEAGLGIKVEAASAEDVVRNSDIVVTTTPATTPIIKEEWLHSGLHITAMGSDAQVKQELEAGVLERADLLVCDVKNQSRKLGEIHHAVDQEQMMKKAVEIGEITAGRMKGRVTNEQVTVCDLTGTGVQDTAIALYTYNLLKEKKAWASIH